MTASEAPAGRMIFLNLPVEDLPRARTFYEALGFSIEPRFSDDNAACVVVEPGRIFVMLLVKPFFSTFTTKQICDARTHQEALIALSCPSRDAVDAMVAKALESGGAETGMPAKDHGFMYYATFQDPDGHHWEAIWMASGGPEGWEET
jgi:predicted lactoylglutathione lyase